MAGKDIKTSALSLTEELVQKIQARPYKKYVAKLREQDAVTGENYKNSRWANFFTVDASNTVRNGRANPNHLFELFGSFSGHSGTEVRIHLLKNITSDTSFYKERCAACLQSKDISFEVWVEQLADERIFCDELALMGLCNLYQRHCVVLTQNKLWSTIQADAPMNLLDLLKECSICLIYLGNQRFGVLTWRPRLPKKVASKSRGFNIVEEYTLDEDIDPTKQAGDINKIRPTAAGNVVTGGGDDRAAPVHQTLHKVMERVEAELKAMEACGAEPLHVVTESKVTSAPATEENQSMPTTYPTEPVTAKPRPVTCPEDGITLNQYPWKNKPEVYLERVSDLESDIWCNRVKDYYKFTPAPDVTPVISDIKGYGSHKRRIKEEVSPEDQSQSQSDTIATDKLIDQANALINTAKQFVTKPVKRKYGLKSGSPLATGKTKAKDSALEVLQEQTIRNLTTFHVGTDGAMKPSTESPPLAKSRKIRCKLCDKMFSSVKGLNTHHHMDHGIVQCPKCGKYFSTQSSLDKHSYSHQEAKFSCELCGKCFQFESRLNQHMVTHITKKLPCPKKSCNREFKNIGDLNRHMNVHTEGGWYYCNQCSYKNKDKRNTDSHMRKHEKPEDGCYECDKCGKKMKYSMQYKRHREQGCL